MSRSFFKKRLPNIVWLWLVLILFILSLMGFEAARSDGAFIRKEQYHVFRDDLKNERVKGFAYSQPDASTGQQTFEITRRDDSRYKTLCPNLEADLLQELSTQHVEIKELERGLFGSLLSLALWGLKIFSGSLFILLIWNWLLRGEFSLSLASEFGPADISSRWKNLKETRTNHSEQLTGHITLADIAGCAEAKQETQELIDYLKDPTPFEKLGARMPKGVLFAGPPGTGKTLLAKAIAAEANVPFLACAGSEFDEKYVGVGASRVRQIFSEAKRLAPCVIFLDEIDSIGQKRGSSAHARPADSQTLNQFLIEMDGFEPNDRILIFAATNRAHELDPALVRPGRFDRHVILNYPTQQERLEILEVHAKKIKHNSEIDWSIVARMTVGFAGADLANLLNESALVAVRHQHQEVLFEDLLSAYDRVLMGLERKALMPSAIELERTAYHEAGHALVSLALEESDPIHKLTILPRGQSLGATYSVPESERIHLKQSHCYQKLAICCGGRAAEALIYGPYEISTGSSAGESSDMAVATKLARAMVEQYGFAHSPVGLICLSNTPSYLALSPSTLGKIEESITQVLNLSYEFALKILTANRELLDKIQSELLAKETLDQKDLSLILQKLPLRYIEKSADEAIFCLKSIDACDLQENS